MSLITRSLLLAAPALLAGCAAYPVAPGYYAGSYDYSNYGPPYYYYQPAPVYVVPHTHHPHPGADGGHHAGTHSRGHSSGRGGGGRGHR